MRSYCGFLKQSSNATICMGPFVEAADGVSQNSGLTATLDGASGIFISKAGASMAIRTVTGLVSSVYDSRGYYRVTLLSGDVNTLGSLVVDYSEGSASGPYPVTQEYTVVPANVYDSLVGGSSNLQVDIVKTMGGASGASGLDDFGKTGYNSTTHKVTTVVTAETATNLTNAPTAGDLTSTMKASVTTACTAATPAAASVTNPVTVSGDLSATMKTSVETAVRNQIDAVVATGAATGSVGKLCTLYLDAAISSRLGPTGVLSTVTNLTNAPTSGDFTSTMKTSLVSGINSASGMVVASVAGAVASVTDRTGFSLSSSGLDVVAAPTDLSSDSDARSTYMKMFRALFNRFYDLVSQSSTQQIVKNDAGTVISTMPVTLSGGVETKGKSV